MRLVPSSSTAPFENDVLTWLASKNNTGALLIWVSALRISGEYTCARERELFILLCAGSTTDADAADNLTVDRDRDSAL